MGASSPDPAPIPSPAARASREGVTRAWTRRAWSAARVTGGLFLAYALLFNVSVVRGNSMSPNIHDGDRILIQPWSFLFEDVDRGDIVVLRYPLDPRLDYIKRVIGIPGDDILIGGGKVYVNGVCLDEPYVDLPDFDSFQRVVVEEGHYFVLGDNRRRSSDSREFGLVPAANLRGKVEVRLWPLARIGSID